MDGAEVDVYQILPRHGRGLLVLAGVIAIAASACSGASSTPISSAVPTATAPATEQPTESTSTLNPTASVCDLGAADAAFAGLSSYAFEMTLAGAAADTALANLPIDQTDSYLLKGTIVNTPDPGADITIAKFHVIEVGGVDYFDADGNGSFTQIGGAAPTDQASPADSTAPGASTTPQGSLADQFSPETLFGAALGSTSSSGFSDAGPETKAGVEAEHCSGDPTALAALGAVLGISPDATWASDVWIAKAGGYPIAMTLDATNKDQSVAYGFDLTLSKVNDPSNKIVAPTNITGA
jgi:hypothetical protein